MYPKGGLEVSLGLFYEQKQRFYSFVSEFLQSLNSFNTSIFFDLTLSKNDRGFGLKEDNIVRIDSPPLSINHSPPPIVDIPCFPLPLTY